MGSPHFLLPIIILENQVALPCQNKDVYKTFTNVQKKTQQTNIPS